MLPDSSGWVSPSNWGSSRNPSNASILSVARLVWQYRKTSNKAPSQTRASPVHSHKGLEGRETSWVCVCVPDAQRFFHPYMHTEAAGQGFRGAALVNSDRILKQLR